VSRKVIPDEVQQVILTKSRRRCCLCFWLDGKDDVQRGQIAHIDHNNENADEKNLVFLCLDHHDQFDGKTSQSKGLKPDEVRHWRDELYREMEYRFRSFRKRGFTLNVVKVKAMGPEDQCNFVWCVTNIGEISVRSPTVTIQLLEGMGMAPTRNSVSYSTDSYMPTMTFPMFDPYAMEEKRADFFEPNGRVGVREMGGHNPVLMPGHDWTFESIQMLIRTFGLGAEISLQYRVDAEECTPFTGTVRFLIPDSEEGFDISDFRQAKDRDDEDEDSEEE
jgi:hypothetical protein